MANVNPINKVHVNSELDEDHHVEHVMISDSSKPKKCLCCKWNLRNKIIVGVTTAIIIVGIILIVLWQLKIIFVAKAKVAFHNTLSGRRLNTYESTTYFAMKLTAAYLAEDIDPVTYNNIGNTEMFYLNPECNNDIQSCTPDNINNYFNFAQSSDQVNTALNAQGRNIAIGTYKYVRLEFCKYTFHSNNLAFQGLGMSNAFYTQIMTCTVNSAKMDPPLSVAMGDSVVVQLSYNLTDLILMNNNTHGGNNGRLCTEEMYNGFNTTYCAQVPTFIPSAIKI